MITTNRKSERELARLRVAVLAAVLAVGMPVAMDAALAVTAPVGFMGLTVPTGTDVLVSAPLQRPAVFTGRVAAVDGDRITVEGAPGWSVDALVYAQGVRPETYHAQLGSGAMRGAFFTITANDADSLTLDLNGEMLDKVAVGDRLTVRPYWTLGTLLGPESGFPGSPTFTPRAEVQFVDAMSAGINLATAQQFFYYTGVLFGGAGWRKDGEGLGEKFDNTILYPDTPFRIRNTSGSVMGLSLMGFAPVAGHRTTVGTLAAGVSQDNFVTMMSAQDITLGESGLFESGAVAGSPTFTPVDSVLLFDNEEPGRNKAASGIYFYYTGAAFGGPGWRKDGGGLMTKYDTTVLAAQTGFVVRKGSGPIVDPAIWGYVPYYVTD